MKLRNIVVSLMTISLLSSCANDHIRSDIEQFIASFSLEESIATYLEAGYIETKVATQNETVTKDITEFSFNVKDKLHPKYKKTVKTYINDIFSKEISEEIIEEGSAFFFVKTGEEKVEYSYEQISSLITKFFYKEIKAEVVHLYGMYYGDYINQIVTSLQSYVTIDTEKQLYCYEAEQDSKNASGEEVYTKQSYQVNSLGMLEKNDLTRSTKSLTVTTHIETYRL